MNKINKIIDYCSCILFSISLIVLFGCLAVLPIAKSKRFYMKEHQKNNVEDILETKSFNGIQHYCTNVAGEYVLHTLPKYDVTQTDIENATNHIIDYLYHEEVESMQFQIETTEGSIDFFSEQAIIHMADVKVLFIGGIKMTFTFLAIFLLSLGWIIYRNNHITKLLGKTYFICVGIFIALTVLVMIYALHDFDEAFVLFHKIIFPNSDKVDLALSFNNCDTLTNILTGDFFMHIGLYIGILFISLLIISVLIDYIFYKFGNKIISLWKKTDKKKEKCEFE